MDTVIQPSTFAKSRRHKVPAHLGGYQAIENGKLKAGDLFVWTQGTTRVAEFASWDGEGLPVADARFAVSDTRAPALAVYRKMAVPKQGDGHGDWRKVRAKLQAEGSAPVPARAKTDDGGKPPLACLPLKALREVALVQLYGQQKYGDFYNYKKGMELSRGASCALRHIADFMDGNDLDHESKRSHLAHAACRLLFMLENLADGKAIDDRYKPQL